MNRLGAEHVPFLFILDFDLVKPVVVPLAEASGRGIFYDFNGLANTSPSSAPKREFTFQRQPIPFVEYSAAFSAVTENLRRGNSYLLNLTFPTPITTDLTLKEIFEGSVAKYRLMLDDTFVTFSPETFVQIRDGIISSYPMKGTIDARTDRAESIILEDAKEHAEHTTIVDLIRNDLSMVAEDVKVRRFRYVDLIRTNQKDLLQVSSQIEGRLPRDFYRNIGTIIYRLLPAGSVTGAPKKKTVEIIRSVEACPRGYYTGVAGYFDGQSLDSCVMIRFIEKCDGRMIYRSGGGITVYSQVEKEYEEMMDKVYVPIV